MFEPVVLFLSFISCQTIDGFTTAIMVVISICFLPASYAIFVVKERAVKAKHQQASHSVMACIPRPA